ncbi:hypothetical protein TNCV_4592061 [Trichonephila clavipes]|nr:hypothetical protein TNCV_4592061 [Trichonephila clavipes]
MVTPDLFNLTKRSVLKDHGSGHREVLTEIEIPNADQRPFSPSKISRNFKKTNWYFTELLEHDLCDGKLEFTLNTNKVYRTIKGTITSCAKRSIPRGGQHKYIFLERITDTSLKAKRDSLI